MHYALKYIMHYALKYINIMFNRKKGLLRYTIYDYDILNKIKEKI